MTAPPIACSATRPTRRAAASSSFVSWCPPTRPSTIGSAVTSKRAWSAGPARPRARRVCRSAGSWRRRARTCARANERDALSRPYAGSVSRPSWTSAGSAAPIVVNAAGCGAQLKAYAQLLADDPAWARRARDFSARVRDASEAVDPVAVASRAPRPMRVAYQDACHLAHGQGIRREPRTLLAAVANVTIVPIADAERCCGSAGIYNLTHPEVAQELQRQKVAAILEARPDVVVSANPGCILQIASGLRQAGSAVPVVHLMRFLDDPAASLGALEA